MFKTAKVILGGVAALVALALLTAQRPADAGLNPARQTSAVGKVPARAFPRFETPRLAGPAVPDTITLKNESSQDFVMHPVTFSRFFAPGEIPAGFDAGAEAEGVQLPTQCDVKTRWPDGSLQHAVLTFLIDLPKGGSSVVFLVPREPAPAEPLSSEEMLSQNYNLGAFLELASAGEAYSINVRDMIRAGHFRYWLRGALCTQVIVEEVSPDPQFDIAFNGHKSFHPIFVLTFYPGRPGVRVEFIGENSWTNRAQTINYALALKTGQDGETATVYQKDSFSHIAFSRWRKIFWSGPAIPAPFIDHNLPYLVYSRVLPNYDLSRNASRGAALEIANAAKTTTGDLGENAVYFKYMPTTGGRGDLGIAPRWDIRYLYAPSPRLREIIANYSEVGAHFPIHYREGVQGRGFSALAPGTDALGRVVSIDARPGFCSRAPQFSTKRDGYVAVGAVTSDGWTPDMAHQPAFTFVSYLLTGDWYYLEEMYFWAAWNLAFPDPGKGFNSRGSVGGADVDSFGFMWPHTNIRAYGWTLRNLAHAALFAPDNSVEKAYFTDKLLNNLAVHEGRLNITDGYVSTAPERQAMWRFGREVVEKSFDNQLAFLQSPFIANVNPNDTMIDAKKVTVAYAPWMQTLTIACLGHITELGFPFQRVLARNLDFIYGQLTDPAYNKYLVDTPAQPVAPSLSAIFTSWRDVRDGYTAAYQNKTTWSGYLGDAEFGWGYIALSAASYLPLLDQSGKDGTAAWQWLKDNYPRQDSMDDNPKWAIVPRAQQSPGSVAAPATWAARFKASMARKRQAAAKAPPAEARSRPAK